MGGLQFLYSTVSLVKGVLVNNNTVLVLYMYAI